MNIKPVIGITPSIDENFIKLNSLYCEAIEKFNASAIILNYSKDCNNIINFLDGIILSGGGDISEKYLNEKIHPKANTIYPERDEYEIKLIKSALEKDIPILGICRGAQIINIALGGSIIQHIEFHMQKEKRNIATHNINIIKNSKLYNILECLNTNVNSFHHQCIDKPGKDIIYCAYSNDAVIEAIEHKYKKFCIGVQWHPEALFEDNRQKNIFKTLVKYSIDFHNTNKVY